MKEKTVTGQRDPRLQASFLYDSTDPRGPDYTLVYGTTWTNENYPPGPADQPGTQNTVCFRKFLTDSTSNTSSFHSPNNYRFIRYADVLLLYAEALNATGQTAQAYQYVDRVRARAGLAPLSTTMPGLSQQQFLDQLKHERITELSGEGHRWEDLDRWMIWDRNSQAVIRALLISLLEEMSYFPFLNRILTPIQILNKTPAIKL